MRRGRSSSLASGRPAHLPFGQTHDLRRPLSLLRADVPRARAAHLAGRQVQHANAPAERCSLDEHPAAEQLRVIGVRHDHEQIQRVVHVEVLTRSAVPRRARADPRTAGRRPKNMPVTTAIASAVNTAHTGISAGRGVQRRYADRESEAQDHAQRGSDRGQSGGFDQELPQRSLVGSPRRLSWCRSHGSVR